MPSIPLEVKQNVPCPYFSTRLAPRKVRLKGRPLS